MDQLAAYHALLEHFRRLTVEERANLAWHAGNGTRILVGEAAALYADGEGGD